MTYSPNEAFSAPASQATAVNYAPWLSRVGSYLIDGLVTAPFAVLAVLFGRGTDAETGQPTITALYWVFLLLGFALSGYNRWYLGGKTGQSWGRKAVGIRLVGEQTG